jgi:putative DNA primase/helicase
MSKLMDSALAYAARGWRVFPVYPIVRRRCGCGKDACSSPGKHPRIRGWEAKATTDRAQIEAWWKNISLSNIGIATGVASGIVVVDVDPRHGGDASLAKLNLPDTYTVQTGGGGRHLYFQHPGGEIRNSAGTVALGIDIRGDGGFVVAPPSNHASGEDYAVLADVPLAPFPSELLSSDRGSEPRVRGPVRSARRRGKENAADFPDIVKEGSRNTTLTSEAGRLRNLGLNKEELLAKLLVINTQRCDPPLDDTEVARIAGSVARYEPRRQLTDLGNAERLADRHGDKLRYCAQQRSWYVWDGMRWRHDVTQQVALLSMDTVRTIYEEAAGVLDSSEREKIAHHALESESGSSLGNMQRLAQALDAVAIRADALDTDPWLLTVLNGTIDLRTGELSRHDPMHLITKLAPVTYDPEAKSKLWDGFLRDVTGDGEELMVFLQRAAGYSLTGRTTEHAVFFVYGPRRPARASSRAP